MCCGDDVSGSSPRCPSRVESSRGTCVSWRFADGRSLCVCSPCRVASQGSWQTCRRPAATTPATARRNETRLTERRTNWILCCLFCAIAVHSTFLQGSGAFIGYYLKTCLEFKHDSLIYCVATLGQRISSLYIYVYKLIYSVFSHTGNLKMTNLFCKTNVAWWASGDFFPMMSLLMQRRCHDTRCWFIVGAYDQRFWDLNSYCAVLHLYRWMWFYLVMTKSLLLCNTAVLLKWIKYYLKFGTEIRLIFSHLHWHWHTDVPVC